MLAALNRNRRTRGVLVFVAVAFASLTLGAAVYGQETLSPIPRPEPFTFVNDYAGVMDQSSKTTLEAILTNLATQQKIEMSVVTVRTTGDQDIFDYSLAIGRGWKIGTKDSDQAGLLLVVAIDDRKYFTQVSRHLEGELSDGLVGQIQREKLVPQFRRGNYSQGIYDTMMTYVATVAEKRGFNIPGVDQKQAYRPERQRESGSSGICGVIVIIAVILLLFMASRGGRGGRGGGGSGLWSMLMLGSALSGMSRGSSSSGWSGGSFGGSGGGFGGGGDFGGGGAGGSW